MTTRDTPARAHGACMRSRACRGTECQARAHPTPPLQRHRRARGAVDGFPALPREQARPHPGPRCAGDEGNQGSRGVHVMAPVRAATPPVSHEAWLPVRRRPCHPPLPMAPPLSPHPLHQGTASWRCTPGSAGTQRWGTACMWDEEHWKGAGTSSPQDAWQLFHVCGGREDVHACLPGLGPEASGVIPSRRRSASSCCTP